MITQTPRTPTTNQTVRRVAQRRLVSRTASNNNVLIIAILMWIATLPVFIGKALNIYTESQRTMAWLLFSISTIPFFVAAVRKVRRVPLMLLLSAQYAVFYALPVFFEGSIRSVSGSMTPDASAIDMTLFCAVLSLLAIAIGYTVSGKVLRLRFSMLHFRPSPDRLFWFAVVSLTGSALLQLGQGTILGWLPGAFTQPLNLILSADLGVAILACLYYQNAIPNWGKWIALVLLFGVTAAGLAGGMFQSAVQPLLIWAICRWIIRGKVPIVTLVVVAAAFFVFQPVKGSYRKMVWLSGRSFTTTEKLEVYGRLLKEQWIDDNGARGNIVDVSRQSAQTRLSLLLTTAHYIGWTPNPIDYKNGSTLGFLVYGWIPRAMWPGKPIAQEANKILPAQYNLQDVTTQNVTMFGVGHVAEAYVNFGLVGIVPLFVILGILYRVPQLLLERQRTTATIAIFVAVTVAMVPIGSSISNAFGGFLQQIVLQGFLLRVLTRDRSQKFSRDMARGAMLRRATLSPASGSLAVPPTRLLK